MKSNSLKRVVLVTGGTTRLGAVIADYLELLSWRVIRTSHRADAGADIVVDLSRPDGPEMLFKAAEDLLGDDKLDAIVNNAALFALDDTDVMALNYYAPKRLIELMSKEAHSGVVVNILDSRILYREALTSYERSKKALKECTLEYARRYLGVLRVNAVAPGPVLVPTTVHEAAGRTPFGRPEPKDVARAVAFLLDASTTTGCIIPVDGGQSIFTYNV